MLTSIEIRTKSNQSLTIDFEEYDSEFYIKDITGLDPVKADIASSGIASTDGIQYQSSRRGARNPVLTIGLQSISDRSIRTLRQYLYQFLMPKSEVTLIFYDDEHAPLSTSGRVESFESSPFQRDPEAVISIICFDPAFYSIAEKDGFGLVNAVENIPVDIPYEGTIGAGFTIDVNITFAQSSNSIELNLEKPDGTVEFMEIIHPLQNGDTIRISSVTGDKFVHLIRNGQMDSILYTLTYQSTWPTLSPGTNTLRFNTGGYAAVVATWLEKHGGL